MAAMGMAYLELLQDPDLLQVQLHGFVAAAADPDIASACQDTFRRLWRLVDAATHAEPAVIREFFAQGMLCNVFGGHRPALGRGALGPVVLRRGRGEARGDVGREGDALPSPRLRPAPALRRGNRRMLTFLTPHPSPAKLVTNHNLADPAVLPTSDKEPS